MRRVLQGSFVYLVFACAALVWTWVLPIWQGPDESAHFSYVQYMIVHNRPPKVAIVPPGRDPWAYGASKSAVWSKMLTERNWVLTHPDRYLSIRPSRRYDVLHRLHALSGYDANQPSEQNYVGIYPPLYYGVIGKLIHFVGIANIHHQAYIARLWSVFLFGWVGVTIHRILSRVVAQPALQISIACTIPLLFPTFSMLGGVVNNDVVMDEMCLLLFLTVLDGLRRTEWRPKVALVYGVVFGSALISKPEVYIIAALCTGIILLTVLKKASTLRTACKFLGICAGVGLCIALPWFAVSIRYYHTVIPPLTYQAKGGWPRSTSWFLHNLVLSRVYQMHLMLVQIASGIDYPWWRRPVTWGPFYALWGVTVFGVMYVGGWLLLRRDKVLFVIALVWTTAIVVFLWYTAYRYLLDTGSNFIQGRYFFAILPVFVYTAGLALRRRWQSTCLLVLAAGGYLTVISATVYRYYHSTLWHMFIGHVVTYDPATIIVGGQLALVTLLVVIIRLSVRQLTVSFRKWRHS